jgi:hypothetical protein
MSNEDTNVVISQDNPLPSKTQTALQSAVQRRIVSLLQEEEEQLTIDSASSPKANVNRGAFVEEILQVMLKFTYQD